MNTAYPRPFLALDLGSTPAENRRLKRDRTAKACTIVHGMFREHHQGVVRDIHADGARVRPAASPDTFQGRLELIVDGQIHHGVVAWRNRTEMGIRFEVADPLAVQTFSRL